MASERMWRAVSQLFATDGTSSGSLTVVSVRGFKVKAKVLLSSNTQPSKEYEIKAIPNATTIEVGDVGEKIEHRSDISAYLVSDAATITQPRQKRPAIGPGEMDRAIYEEEPTVADRVILVDEVGELINEDNPLPVNATVSIGDIQVDLDADDGDNVAVSAHPLQIRDQAPDTLTTAAFEEIYSYTSTSSLSRITQVSCTASTPCTFRLYIDSTLLRERRSSPLERNVDFSFTEHLALPIGAILKVEAMVDRLLHASYDTHTAIEGYFT